MTLKAFKMRVISFNLLFLLGATGFFSCGGGSKSEAPKGQAPEGEKTSKTFTFNEIADAIKSNDANKQVLVDFSSNIAPIDYNQKFDFTPTGGYINRAIDSTAARSKKLNTMTSTVLDWIGKHPKCQRASAEVCSAEFKLEYKDHKQKMLKDLEKLSEECLKNEIRNQEKFAVFYYAFPGANRLFIDVLRKIRSFEYLTQINNTYPFRDFSFQPEVDPLGEFLRGWWPAYVEYAKSQGKDPYAKDSKDAGYSVGLTFYPDSIIYAKKNLISANLSLFGNNTNLLNNTLFFFLNNRSATKGGGYDQFIKATLSPYVLKEDGTTDEESIMGIIAKLNNVYDQYLSKGGGNLAQIFIRKDLVPQVSFMAWNGGEPVWFSRRTKTAIQTKTYDNKPIFKPTNVFWPNAKQSDYFLFNLANFQENYGIRPKTVQQMFPVTGNTFQGTYYDDNADDFLEKLNPSQEFTNNQWHKNYPMLEQFTSMDIAQARIIPTNDMFNNESAVGVKLYTANAIDDGQVRKYQSEIDNIINEVFMKFVERVNQGVVTLKPGTFPLKKFFGRE